jgi:hypothetical protein
VAWGEVLSLGLSGGAQRAREHEILGLQQRTGGVRTARAPRDRLPAGG